MIAPLTDDAGTIRYILPALDTKLVPLQGHPPLKPALDMARADAQARRARTNPS